MKPGLPSESALRIALTQAAAAKDPLLRPLLADPQAPFLRWFIEAHSREASQRLARRLSSRAGAEAERRNLGGEVYHLLRKRFVEDEVRAAVADGAAQAVILGAGYDALGVRLAAALPQVRFCELDHPDTQAVKKRALEEHSASVSGLTLLAVDLSQAPLAEVLKAAGFRESERSVFVAEGLLPYLEATAVNALFAAVRGLLAPGSRFVFTMADSRVLGDPGTELARNARVGAIMGEPILSSEDGSRMAEFLAERGFRMVTRAESPDLRRRYLEPRGLDLPVGVREFLVVAEA